jgi:cytochrome c biogenesis protein CcmG/thiol:disulfide interchange protein DsbE
MKHLSKLLGTAGIAAVALLAAPAMAISEGQMAPEISLPGKSGTVRLSALRGKLVYVDFWASWCEPCKESFPWLNEMQSKYGPAGLQVIGVNVDANRADADKFLGSVPAKFTIAYDSKGETPSAFGVKGMPSSYLVAPDGKVVLVHAGFSDNDKAELEGKIKAALVKK